MHLYFTVLARKLTRLVLIYLSPIKTLHSVYSVFYIILIINADLLKHLSFLYAKYVETEKLKADKNVDYLPWHRFVV